MVIESSILISKINELLTKRILEHQAKIQYTDDEESLQDYEFPLPMYWLRAPVGEGKVLVVPTTESLNAFIRKYEDVWFLEQLNKLILDLESANQGDEE